MHREMAHIIGKENLTKALYSGSCKFLSIVILCTDRANLTNGNIEQNKGNIE